MIFKPFLLSLAFTLLVLVGSIQPSIDNSRWYNEVINQSASQMANISQDELSIIQQLASRLPEEIANNNSLKSNITNGLNRTWDKISGWINDAIDNQTGFNLLKNRKNESGRGHWNVSKDTDMIWWNRTHSEPPRWVDFNIFNHHHNQSFNNTHHSGRHHWSTDMKWENNSRRDNWINKTVNLANRTFSNLTNPHKEPLWGDEWGNNSRDAKRRHNLHWMNNTNWNDSGWIDKTIENISNWANSTLHRLDNSIHQMKNQTWLNKTADKMADWVNHTYQRINDNFQNPGENDYSIYSAPPNIVENLAIINRYQQAISTPNTLRPANLTGM